MKKIIGIIITLFLMNLSIVNAKASTSYQILECEIIETNSARILKAGYYVLGADEDLTIQMVIGDASTSFFDGANANEPLTKEKFSSLVPVKKEHSNEVNELIKQVNDYCIDASGVISYSRGGFLFIRVDSYAVLVNEKELTYVDLFYLPTAKENTDTSIAGSKTHIVNIASPLSLEEIKQRYTAFDNVDKDITSQIQFLTNYNPQNIKLGTFYILATVVDSSGNKTSVADIILVKDFEPPVVSLATPTKSIEVNEIFTGEDAKKLFSVTDNWSKNISLNFIDNYNDCFDTVGIYTITAYAIDEEGNVSKHKTLTIFVNDSTAPTIHLKAGGNTIIADHVLTDDEIRALMIVEDNYDSISQNKIEIIENTCDGEQVKDFIIKVQVKDEEENYSEPTSFIYRLTDTESPIIMVSQTLYIEVGLSLTNEQIINMLKEAGIVDTINNITISSDYFNDTKNEGTYELHYEQILEDGTVVNGVLSLEVFSPVGSDIVCNPSNNAFHLAYLFSGILIISFVIFRWRKHEIS